ncbi:15-hydroxyprostaglandin dehydrogenase [NAD(+)]-like [Diorhabda carinulata]|uniref:15-hydroxyprostaglandin dehydrogenase [NAD(+)]-like n=1 Tax=Diorhabda carinulata TaxID=1163345 RepID=UPI0025A07D00|nr:15-hydroxyprostaglandin dehydrogenase [NAD(+)]-like [Diorhabda carinulata]
MVFNINGKFAVITGGASGIGLHYAKELLRNGLQGITLADINPTIGKTALEEIEKEFGPGKAIFVETDVTSRQQFENAFQKTVDRFKHIDILINNAGILNDRVWEREIDINMNGTIHGILLATEKFLTKYQQGPEAVIVNIASTAAWDFYPHIPIYSATKSAVIALTKSWGVEHFYNKWNIRFIAICPGITFTPLIFDMSGRNLGKPYEEHLQFTINKWPGQKPEHVAEEVMRVIKFAPNGTAWLIEGGEPAYEVIPIDRNTQKKNLLQEN